MRRRRGNAKMLAMLVLLVGGAGGLLYVAYRAAGAKAKQEQPAKNPAAGPDGPMSEEERVAYVKAHVRVTGLEVGPDTEPDSDKVVPGLFRVTGTVTNGGERKIEKAVLTVYPKGETGEVLGSYVENVAADGLAAGASAQFKFIIPEKKGYGGTFDYKLR